MINNLIRFSINNKLIIIILIFILIIWGIWSSTKLSIDALPDITDNQVQIITNCPSLAAQEVEKIVTANVEKTLSNIPDVIEMRSFSRFGLSVITVVFKEKVDIYFARQLINERLKEAIEFIPQNVGRPELAPITTGLGEIYQYILHPKKGSESKYSSMDLRTIQDWIVARQLYGIDGVAEITGFGGETKQYEVSVNPKKLHDMNVSISEIYEALEKNNQNTGGSYIDKKPNALFIRSLGVIKDFDDINNIRIKTQENGIPILIRDIAEVKFGSPPRYGALTYNGEKEAVGGIVMMLKGANSSEVIKKVKDRIELIKKSLPNDIIIEPYLDRTKLVNRAINTVKTNLIEGALIVIIVLVLFLGNLRAGLIVASVIPLSLLFALAMMNLFGISANLMSLGAIDFGLIVDGAVILVESTLYHLFKSQNGNTLTQQEMNNEVYISSLKIRNSAAFGEIIILIVYIPILTLVGIEGKMFRPMALTVGFAIFGALILSLTYIPMMSSLFLSKKINHKDTFSDKMMKYFQKYYSKLLNIVFNYKKLVIYSTIITFIISIFIFINIGAEFTPTLEEGDYAIEFVLPKDASLKQTTETILLAERIIKSNFKEVKMLVGKTGAADVATDPMPIYASDIMVILKNKDEWEKTKNFEELAEMIKQKLETIPGIIAEPSQPIQMRFNELMTGIRQDVAIKIFGENIDTLSYYAEKVKSTIKNIEGITEPQIERVSGLPQISIEYERNRLNNYGIDISTINEIISTAFAGKIAGSVYENERKFDLVVRLDENYRNSIEDVGDMLIPTNDGYQIPLNQIANISYKIGPSQISREDGKRRIYIAFNVNSRDVQTVINEIKDKLDIKVDLPPAYYFTFGGQFENLQNASKRLLFAVPLSLVIIFILLYFTFHNIRDAILIFTAIPMSAIGGIFALYFRSMPFSISAGIGFIALFGVAVLNGIVLINTYKKLDTYDFNHINDFITKGSIDRLRAVLMTAAVASMGFLPMAFSNGAGAEVQKPLATVVIGGLISATFLTLFVLPILYILFNKSLIKNIYNSKLLIIVILLFPTSYFTQIKNIITVEHAIELAINNNIHLKSKNEEMSANIMNNKSIYNLPNLEINSQFGQYSSIEKDNSFHISQSFPFPTIFKTKKELLKLENQIKNIDIQKYENDLKTTIRKLFNEIQFLSFYNRKLTELDSIYIEFVRIAEIKYKSGDAKKIEIITANTQEKELLMQINNNNVLIQNAYNKLSLLLNNFNNFEIFIPQEYKPMEYNSILDTNIFYSQNPEIKFIINQNVINSIRINLEKKKMLPNINLAYSNQSLTGNQSINNQDIYFLKSDRFHYFNIGLSIPINYWTLKSHIKSLNLQNKSIENQLDYKKLELSVNYNNMLEIYKSQLIEYEYYINTALQNSYEISKAAYISYSAGEISHIEYQYTINNVSTIYLNYLNKIYELNDNIINIKSINNQ